MSFGDLTKDTGLAALNKHLETRSYVNGHKLSTADTDLLCSIFACVDAKKYPHVSRWLTHVTAIRPCASKACSKAEAKPAAAAAAPKAEAKPAAAAKPAAKKEKKDEDDPFAMSSEEDDEATLAIIAKKNAEKAEKNKGKPQVIDKSSIILSVKPFDSETDMLEVAKRIRAEVVPEGLVWGDHELVPVAYGIKKLKIICVIEDAKVCLDQITEAIEGFDEQVQSVDVDAFNKL